MSYFVKESFFSDELALNKARRALEDEMHRLRMDLNEALAKGLVIHAQDSENLLVNARSAFMKIDIMEAEKWEV